MSSGFGGRGSIKLYDTVNGNGEKKKDGPDADTVETTDEVVEFKLYDVGWIASAGSLVPLSGRWTDNIEKAGPHSPEHNKKLGEGGTLVALAQASGGTIATECFRAFGLTNFDRNAVVALI